MRVLYGVQKAIRLRPETFTYPILPGTPVSRYGAFADGAAAYGLIQQRIGAPTENVYIVVGGEVEAEVGDYPISADAKKALRADFNFIGESDQVQELPAVTAADNGCVLMVSGGKWVKSELPVVGEVK